MNLGHLISPHSSSDFFSEVWEQRILHVSRGDECYFASLRDALSIPDIIWQSCPKWGDVSLARANTNYSQSPYGREPPTVSAVMRAVAEGYTLVINSLERKNLKIAELCRNLEKQWYFTSNVNLYATSANTQGLDYHYDDQDVFIVQLEGEKLWRIYHERAELPLDDGRYEEIDCTNTPYDEYKLRPGDVFYIPRGFIHEARALDSMSVHLTISVSAVRWTHFLELLIQASARQSLDLRRSVPVEILRTGSSQDLREEVSALTPLLSNEQLVARALDVLQDNLLARKERLPVAVRFPSPTLSKVTTSTRVGVAPDQIVFLKRSGAGFVLKFIGASMEFSNDLLAAVELLCCRESFLVEELPGGLTSDAKISLIEQLMDCALLVPWA